jgi:hypothetical protein
MRLMKMMKVMKTIKLIFSLALLMALVGNAGAHEGHYHGRPLAVSVALDTQGNLWRASVKDGFVVVDKSLAFTPLSFTSPKNINEQTQKIGTSGDARPKIVIANNGNIYVTWTQALPAPYSGYIWFSRSIDGGKTFSQPSIVHQDRAEITHRFDALSVSASGRIYVAWVDKRDLIAAKKAKQSYDGAAIYYAVSDDQGASFSAEHKVADSSCECCRIAMLANEQGDAVMMWRHLFEGGVRDHAMAKVIANETTPKVYRASFGNWKIDACPHHGPAIAKGGDWGYHMAGFDGGDKAGLFYARMDGEAWVSSTAKRFGDANSQAGHPALISDGEQVWLAWKEMTDTTGQVKLVKSNDGGRSWDAPVVISQTKGKSDYPQLLLKDRQAYLAWNTELDGLAWVKASQ